MRRKFYEPKKFDLVPMCPLCRGRIYWRLHAGRVGAEGVAHCSNHPSSTRVIIVKQDLLIDSCLWEGIVRRNKNGEVDIFNTDGSSVPMRVIHRD